MGYEWSVTQERKLVHLVARGDLDAEGCLAVMRELATALEGQEGFGILIDALEGEYRHSSSEVKTLAQEAGRPGSLRGHRLAVVVSTTAQFGLGRMFSTYLEVAGVEGAVFRDEGAAMDWLAAGRNPPIVP